jgi:hypothetical protein
MARERHATPSPGELDELLRPSVPDDGPRPARAGRPMRLGSQFYVAFFGGAVAATIIALLNAAALGLSTRKRLLIGGLGMLGLAATAVVFAVADSENTRLLARVVGVVAWGGMYLVQRGADRVYAYRSNDDEPYASMWGPGIAVALAGLVVQFGLAEAFRAGS